MKAVILCTTAALVMLCVAIVDVAGGAESSGVESPLADGDGSPPADPTQSGIDQFPSRGRIQVTLDNLPGTGRVTEEIEVSSAGLQDTFVQRGPLQGDPEGGGTIPTEILGMQLQGHSPTLGPIYVTAGRGYGLPPTLGEIRGVQIGGPWHDFSGDSFFDVFFQIDVPESPLGPIFARNEQPLKLESEIFSLPPNRPEPAPERALAIDHYKCYGVRQTRLRGNLGSGRSRKLLRRGRRAARRVRVVDQLEARREVVRTPVLLCNPVAKAFQRDKTGIDNSSEHLVCYRIAKGRKGFEREAVGVKTQFGATTVDLVRREILCLPSRKRVVRGKHRPVRKPTTRRRISHFKCYTASAREPDVSYDVRLVDQFERRRHRVLDPRRVCNPARKNGSRVANALAHMTCHPFTRRKLRPRIVAVRNQFGLDVLTVRRRDSLCLPTHKTRCSEYAEQAKVALMGPGGARVGTVDHAIHVPFEGDPDAACP